MKLIAVHPSGRKIVAPSIHINGSPADRLREAFDRAYETLFQAEEAVIATAPNARDYYIQGPDAFNLAAAEHSERLRKLRSVREELEGLIIAIDEQIEQV